MKILLFLIRDTVCARNARPFRVCSFPLCLDLWLCDKLTYILCTLNSVCICEPWETLNLNLLASFILKILLVFVLKMIGIINTKCYIERNIIRYNSLLAYEKNPRIIKGMPSISPFHCGSSFIILGQRPIS